MDYEQKCYNYSFEKKRLKTPDIFPGDFCGMHVIKIKIITIFRITIIVLILVLFDSKSLSIYFSKYQTSHEKKWYLVSVESCISQYSDKLFISILLAGQTSAGQTGPWYWVNRDK